MIKGKAFDGTVQIEPSDNHGFIVFVRFGTVRLVFNDIDSLLQGLREYLTNPDIFEGKTVPEDPKPRPTEKANKNLPEDTPAYETENGGFGKCCHIHCINNKE